MFNMFSQILRNFLKYSWNYRNCSRNFSTVCQIFAIFTSFRFFLESATILAHFLFAKISPNFYETHNYSWKILYFVSTHIHSSYEYVELANEHILNYSLHGCILYISTECLSKLFEDWNAFCDINIIPGSARHKKSKIAWKFPLKIMLVFCLKQRVYKYTYLRIQYMAWEVTL